MKRSLLILMYFSFFLAAACGDDNNEKNLCEGVTCDAGICDLTSGACINAPDCGTDNDACLAGYECKNTVCTVTVACDIDNPCDRGTCVDNAVCLNPTTCNTNSNCLNGFYCTDDNVCSDDLCSDTVCDNGVCELGTGACVNADSCRKETQEDDCLSGFGCVQGSCVNETDFCDELDCQRGVCSFEEQGCIDATDCAGDDVQCLSGNYCDDNNACQTNRCDVLNTDCPRGVCDPGQGVCVDKENCTASTDCIDAKVCLGGACTPSEEACGTDGCPGNQECAFDEANSSASCQEAATGCASAVDCTGDRVCTNAVCVDPGMCSEDASEPNNITGQETEITSLIQELTICNGDTDLFIFDTTTDPDGTGTLNVVVEINPVDVGLGEIKVELVNPLGNVVQTGSSIVNGTDTATIDVRHLIDVVTMGKYIIRVSGDGVSTAGVRYALRADVVDPNVLTGCGMATVLDPSQPTSGNTAMGASIELKTCGDTEGFNKENIFSLQVDVPSYLTLQALPTPDVDVTLSLRSICGQNDTEIACANDVGITGTETISAPVQPGTYYIIVESAQADEGAYTLVTDLAPIICSPADNTCADATNANVCNAQGTAFENEACENGCDMAIGRCTRNLGDVCDTAIPVTNTYSGSINWNAYLPDYAPDVACVPLDGSNTDVDGEDAVFAVTIPDGSALSATLDRDFGVYVSMYFVTDCLDVNTSCLTGVNDGRFSDETLFYNNDTGADITGFLIVDRSVSSTSSAASPIEISVAPVICTPAESRCVLNRESQTCNAAGTAFDTSVSCEFGCDTMTGKCVTPVNDLCDGAIELTPGVGVTGDISILAASYTADGCSGSGNGRDATYVIRNVQPGSLINVVMVSNFDAVLWAAKECTANVLSTCLALEDDPENLDLVATAGGDYYFVADTFSSGKTTGTFEITATVTQPQCVAGQAIGCLDATTLQYCGPTGQPVDITCAGGCSNDACAMPAGEVCFDAIDATAGFTGSINEDDLVNSVNSDPCGTDSDGGDIHYKVDLQAGETLHVTADGGIWYPQIYLYDNCADPATSCKVGSSYSRTSDLIYTASVAETIFVGVDFESTSADANDAAQIVIETLPPCTNGQPIACNAAGTALQYCVNGVLQNLACGGNGVCTNNACENPSGDLCFDAAPLNGTPAGVVTVAGSYSGSSKGFIADETTLAGACRFNTAGSRDRIYEIPLNQGDSVKVTIDASTDTYIAFAEDCNDANTCLVANRLADSDFSIEFVAPSTQSYFMIVRAENSTTSDFTFDYEVTAASGKVCSPDSFYCLDATTLAACDTNGQIRSQYNCPLGCSNGACTSDLTSDVCGSGQTVVAGAYFIESMANNNDDVDLSNSSCAGNDTPGNDFFYAIDVAANEIIDLSVQAYNEFDDPAIYIFTNCADADMSCLAGQSNGNNAQTLTYQSPIAQTVYVGLDSESSFDDGWFALEIQVRQPDCTPGVTPQACNVETTGFQYCDDTGFLQTYICGAAGSCNGATNRCATPVGDVCLDPFEGTPAALATPETFTGTMSGTNDYSFAPGNICTGSATPGEDQVFIVDLLMGQTLSASLVSTAGTPEDLAIYVTKSCDDLPTSCVAGADGQPAGLTAETITYTATADESVYIIVDSFFGNASGDFDLTVEVN